MGIFAGIARPYVENEGVPDELLRIIPQYERLDEEMRRLYSSDFSISISQVLLVIGTVMFIGVYFFQADHPFYAGVGATISVIAAGRWMYLRSEIGRVRYAMNELRKEFSTRGYYPPVGGRVRPVPNPN